MGCLCVTGRQSGIRWINLQLCLFVWGMEGVWGSEVMRGNLLEATRGMKTHKEKKQQQALDLQGGLKLLMFFL